MDNILNFLMMTLVCIQPLYDDIFTAINLYDLDLKRLHEQASEYLLF